jgi:exonuclease III
MKIATFNINNVNRRLPILLAWLKHESPHVVCLQELKAEDSKLPRETLAAAGYYGIWRGQKIWNGVAILMRGGKPVLTRDELLAARTTHRPATSKQHAKEFLLQASICRTEIRNRAQSSTISLHGSSDS